MTPGSSSLPTGFDPDNPGHDATLRMPRDDMASGSLGIELVELGVGTATVTMTVTESMVNGHAIGHGGYVFLVADTAFACACNSHGPVTVAAHAEITFIRPVHVGDTLIARAVERERFGRSGIYDVTVSTDAGIVAEFRGLSRTIERGSRG
jgi:acyl-CoA thioesterase